MPGIHKGYIIFSLLLFLLPEMKILIDQYNCWNGPNNPLQYPDCCHPHSDLCIYLHTCNIVPTFTFFMLNYMFHTGARMIH